MSWIGHGGGDEILARANLIVRSLPDCVGACSFEVGDGAEFWVSRKDRDKPFTVTYYGGPDGNTLYWNSYFLDGSVAEEYELYSFQFRRVFDPEGRLRKIVENVHDNPLFVAFDEFGEVIQATTARVYIDNGVRQWDNACEGLPPMAVLRLPAGRWKSLERADVLLIPSSLSSVQLRDDIDVSWKAFDKRWQFLVPSGHARRKWVLAGRSGGHLRGTLDAVA
jgi:hypothetical protein